MLGPGASSGIWKLKACSWVTRIKRPDLSHENQSGEENKDPVLSHLRPDQEARLLSEAAHAEGCSVWRPETEIGVTGLLEQVGLSHSGRQTRSMCSEGGTSPVHIRSVFRAWDKPSIHQECAQSMGQTQCTSGSESSQAELSIASTTAPSSLSTWLSSMNMLYMWGNGEG